MRAQTVAMAVPCRRCGALFDLSYDLAQYGEGMAVEEVMRALRTKQIVRTALCWDCRS